MFENKGKSSSTYSKVVNDIKPMQKYGLLKNSD